LFGDQEKTGEVCSKDQEGDPLPRRTRWIDVAARIFVVVFFPYVLGVFGLTTAVPPGAFVPSNVLTAQGGDTGTTRIYPRDTYLNIDDVNYAGKATVRVYTWPDQQPANVAIMKFDLSSIPADAVVQRATLRLALVSSDNSPDATYNVSAHKIVNKNPSIERMTGITSDGSMPWSPSSCCYEELPLAQADLSAPYDVEAVDKTRGFKSWTITEIVQEWLASPATNRGLVLNADTTKPKDRYRYFASADHSNTKLRPYLELQFSAADATPPSVVITAPVSGTVLSDSVTISADAHDPTGIAGIRFQLNGAAFGPELTAAPYTTTVDTTTMSDGTYSLTAVARDPAGNTTTSDNVSVTVRNGLLFLPAEDTFLNINRNNYSREPILATYTWPNNKIANAILMKFDLSAVPNGAPLQEATLHLALVETDKAPEPTYTVSAHKVVNRNPVTAAANGYTFDGATDWTASACCHNATPLAQANISSAYDQRAVDKAMGRKVWTITRMVDEWLANPASNFGLLLNSDATKLADHFRYFASMENPDANLRPYLRVRFTPTAESTRADTTAPAVSVTAPIAGANLSGTINVTAAATDRVGVAGVQFQLDGVNLGGEDNSAPYTASWNTATTTNGSHVVTAVARDAAGNSRTSAAVTVNVTNDTTLPSVSITAPANGAMVSGAVNVNAAASDNVGVASVQFQIDGVDIGAPDTTAPYSASWNTAATSNGNHAVRAVARDAAGNSRTSAALAVTVLNDTTPPSVSITAPASGASVVNTISVTASASDNAGVASVQFKIDGADFGALDTAAPYTTSWNTTAVSNGSHTVSAVARDTAGNSRASAVVTVTVSNAVAPVPAPSPSPTSGISTRYPGDVGIEQDAQVVFVERFDETTPSGLFTRWTDVLNGSSMTFSPDVPPGSPTRTSLKISWSSSSVGGHLYKQLTPGVDDTLYVRYYIKYPVNGSYSHNGIWAGGYNPALNWPNPQAGIKPTGTDRFSAAAEQNPSTLRIDHYDYWMGMHASLDGNYWGNVLLNKPSVLGKAGQWMCVEHMIKLNNPVTASNGEHAVWVDGVKVSHLGQGFPNGFWSGGNFTQDPAGSPFTGFRWRSDAGLNLNYLWLQTYVPNSGGLSQAMNFAHVVAAKSYVGCLAPTNIDGAAPSVSITAPVVGSVISGTATISALASDNVGVAGVQFKVDGVILGSEVTTTTRSTSWNTTTATDGTHVLTAVARDAAGNVTTSAPVTVTVANRVSASSSAPSNEYSGLSLLTDQPWDGIASLGWNYARRSSSKNDNIIADAGAPYSPSNSLRIVFTTDMQRDSEPSVHWVGVPNRREAYTSWWMKLSPNWTCSPAGCGKVTFLFNQAGMGQVYSGVFHSDSSSSPPYRIAANTEWLPYGQKIWYPNVTTTPINPGEWHRYEFYYKWETIPGVTNDGIIRFWVDGVLNGNHTTVTYPPSAFIEFQYAPTLQYPPPAEQYMYVDHTRISVK
jgi:hypothetical protein